MSEVNVFVGFGFGAIQSGLFLVEAHATRRFTRLVVAEVNPVRVAALRANGGRFAVNVAGPDGRAVHVVEGVEILNPTVAADADRLVGALAEAREIATALPSIEFYERGAPSVAGLLRAALQRKTEDPALPPAIVYTAENHNHAAERLETCVRNGGLDPTGRMQMLNTVIGKMSSVVADAGTIHALALAPVTPGAGEAFLVERFNRILISRVTLPGFARCISVFEEKEDLLPFEEAKLYGHNAIHALLGFLALERGVEVMSDVSRHPDLVRTARRAFLDESGAALVRRYNGLDPLFTTEGFHAYADDLLARMLNPWLRDGVDRITRDPLRKLGWNDRLIGAMRLVQSQGMAPRNLACGARAALARLCVDDPLAALRETWRRECADAQEMSDMLQLLKRA